MSFATDINTLMNANSTINALVTGLYFQNAPDNTALSSEFVVFNYELIDDISSFDAYNEMDIYKLDIGIFGGDTVSTNNITEAFRNYLDNYQTSSFRDVRIISDERGIDGEKEQYSTILEYRIIYKST